MKLKLNKREGIWFSSDFHLHHHNVIKFDKRPFEDVEEMHEAIVTNWNSVVQPEDDVFYLGDLTFNSVHNTKWIIDRLNGKIHYIMGNHDKYEDILKYDRWEGIYDILELSILDDDNIEQRKNKYQHMILSHYPILQWPRKHYGSIHLHGHSHHALHKSNPEYYKNGFVMDVGCNGHDYTPVSYLDVKGAVEKSCTTNDYHH